MSWWILTLLFGLFIASLAAWAVYIQKSATRIQERGFFDNGLGTVIRTSDNPTSFRLLLLAYRTFGIIVALATLVSVVGMSIRIAQAVS